MTRPLRPAHPPVLPQVVSPQVGRAVPCPPPCQGYLIVSLTKPARSGVRALPTPNRLIRQFLPR